MVGGRFGYGQLGGVELTVYTENTPLITTKSLIADFQRVGLRAGQTVIVHSSLKSFGGFVAGGAQAVVDALMHVLTPDGTLVMPTHSTENTDPMHWQHPPIPQAWWETYRAEAPAYHPDVTPTRQMGAIVECFRTYPGVIRSAHPAFSFAAWGKQAATITANHPLDNNVGPESPIGRIYDLDGWVFLLGVGYINNTSLHMAEYSAQWPGKTPEFNSSAMIQNGQRVWVTYRDESIETDDFPALGAAYEAETGAVIIDRIGAATVRLMRQRPLIDYAVRWMEANRPASLEAAQKD